jgi:radical SAM protein with 4Fe4S-binding SPASM domain
MNEAELVANTVNKWIGNPVSRSMLKWLSARSGGHSRMDMMLSRYTGHRVRMGFTDRIGYQFVSYIINKGAQSFGVSPDVMKNGLKTPVVRRGLCNVLEGIAHYGVMKPQVCAAPFLVVWGITKQCNLRCKHCYENSKATPDSDELTTEEAKAFIDQLEEMGVVAIAFSGGEPLMREDFFEVAEYAVKRGFYTSVASNGTRITPEVAKKLKDIGMAYVEVSLDGFEKEHDAFRCVPGAWKGACSGIKNCVKTGLDTCVATTATRHNFRIMSDLMDFVEKDLNAKKMIVFNYIPARRGKGIADQDLSPQEREKLMKMFYGKHTDKSCPMSVFSTAPQYARISHETSGASIPTHFTNKEAGKILQGKTANLSEFIGGCGAGRLYCGIEPNGDVQPCVFIPKKIGNIRKKSLKDIWKESDVLKKMRNRERFKGHCGKCEHKYMCGGCRARAYRYFGDVAGPDPGCINNLKYWKRIKAS